MTTGMINKYKTIGMYIINSPNGDSFPGSRMDMTISKKVLLQIQLVNLNHGMLCYDMESGPGGA